MYSRHSSSGGIPHPMTLCIPSDIAQPIKHGLREKERSIPEVTLRAWCVLSRGGKPGGGSLDGTENPGGIKL